MNKYKTWQWWCITAVQFVAIYVLFYIAKPSGMQNWLFLATVIILAVASRLEGVRDERQNSRKSTKPAARSANCRGGH